MPSMKARLLRVGARSGLLSLLLRARRDVPRILMYHGISAESRFEGLRNAAELHLPRREFIEHLKLLRKLRRVIGVSELVNGLRRGDDMSNTVVLTFDDGYENNVTEAAPLLTEYRTPASFFLATNHIGTGRWIWTDRMENAFDKTANATLSWRDISLPLSDTPARAHALRQVKSRLKQMSVAQRDEAVAEIAAALGIGEQAPTNDYRFMTWPQARGLVDAGFEVGAHTMNHAILSRVSPQEAEAEIAGSRNAVMAGTGQCCPVFCYPNGKSQDYNATVVEICRRHFDAAITTEPGSPSANALFDLPRQSVGGDGASLAVTLFRR